jgi:hypothetical protein
MSKGKRIRKITYKMLKPTGRRVYNVHCGLTRGLDHRRILGCGKLATKEHPHKEFYYYLYPGGGVTSTVSLCDKCAKKVGK